MGTLQLGRKRVVAPNGKAHVLIGCSIWYFIHPSFDLTFVSVVIGSLLPDADHPKAPAGRILPLWLFFKHRKFTHTLYGLALFSILYFSLLGIEWVYPFIVGYVSHLIADSTTPMGVKWLGNRGKKKKTAR